MNELRKEIESIFMDKNMQIQVYNYVTWKLSSAIETERDRIIDIVDRVFSLNNKLDKKQWETIKQNFFND